MEAVWATWQLLVVTPWNVKRRRCVRQGSYRLTPTARRCLFNTNLLGLPFYCICIVDRQIADYELLISNLDVDVP